MELSNITTANILSADHNLASQRSWRNIRQPYPFSTSLVPLKNLWLELLVPLPSFHHPVIKNSKMDGDTMQKRLDDILDGSAKHGNPGEFQITQEARYTAAWQANTL